MSGRTRDHGGRGRRSARDDRDHSQRKSDRYDEPMRRTPPESTRRLRPEMIMMDADFKRQPDFKVQIVQPSTNDHAARCAVCIRKVPDIVHHCNSRHLPWFVNAHTACGACYMQYNTVTSLNAHIEANHRHEQVGVKPQLWATCMNEFFGMIADSLRIDINAIPQFVREHRLNQPQQKQKGRNMIPPDRAIYFLEPLHSGSEPFNPENPRSLRDCCHWKIVMRLIAVAGGEVGINLVRCITPERGYTYYPETAVDREEQRKNKMFKRLEDGSSSRFHDIPRHAEHPPNLSVPQDDPRKSSQRSSAREREPPQNTGSSCLASQIAQAVSSGAIQPDCLPPDIGILLTDLVRSGNSADPKIIKELAARTSLGVHQHASSSSQPPRDETSKRAHRDDGTSHRSIPSEQVEPPTKRTRPSRFDDRGDRSQAEGDREKYPDEMRSDGHRLPNQDNRSYAEGDRRRYPDEMRSDGYSFANQDNRSYAEGDRRRYPDEMRSDGHRIPNQVNRSYAEENRRRYPDEMRSDGRSFANQDNRSYAEGDRQRSPDEMRSDGRRFDIQDDRSYAEGDRRKYPDEIRSDRRRYVDAERPLAYTEELKRQTRIFDNPDGPKERRSEQRYDDDRYREKAPATNHGYKDERPREREYAEDPSREYPAEVTRGVIRRYMEEEPYTRKASAVPVIPPKTPLIRAIAAAVRGDLVPARSESKSNEYPYPSNEMQRYYDERGRYPRERDEEKRHSQGETKVAQDTRRNPPRMEHHPPQVVEPPPRPIAAAPVKLAVPDPRDRAPPAAARSDRYDTYPAAADCPARGGAQHVYDRAPEARSRSKTSQVPGPSRVREPSPTDRKEPAPAGHSQQAMQQQLKTLSQGMAVLTDAIMQMNSRRK